MNAQEDQNEQPRIGYFEVADPRLEPDHRKRILERGRECIAMLREKGLDVIEAGEVITGEPQVREAVARLWNEGAQGILIRCAWFLRANVIAGAAQYAESLPVMLWAVANPNDVSFEGLALSHGSLDEIGMPHQTHYDALTEEGVEPVVAWAKACRLKRLFLGAVYGEVGGRCLEMIPGSSDPNQLRKLFGIHVDPMEQWTMIRRAEEIPESEWKPVIERVREEFKVVDADERSLERSAKLYIAGSRIFEERGWSFAGIQCQLEMIDNYLSPCLPIALWNEEGFVVSCETDINNALSMFVCRHTTGRAAMFSDMFYLDPEKRIIHALNCGTGAPSLGGGPKHSEIHEQTPFQGTWDEENQCSLCNGGACCRFTLSPGPVTMVRFGRIDGCYVVHLVEGEAIPHEFNPKEVGGLTAIWPFGYVKLTEDTDPQLLLTHMRSHHATLTHGHIAEVVRRFAAMCDVEVLEQ